MKLYTKSGDDGTTGLFGGRRVGKNDERVVAYGHVDEANAVIGVVIAGCSDAETVGQLSTIQSDLFVVGAVLATPASATSQMRVSDAMIEQLETWIDAACAETEPLKCFVLPGGSSAAATLHLARTVCRRAERSSFAVSDREVLHPNVLIYLNRLSDLLFAMARRANARDGVKETPWIAATDS